MDFVAIDVETANADMASICQIGIATFSNGQPVSEWVSLINPEDDFDDINVSIHGITERHVKNAPTLPQISHHLSSLLANTTTVCHTHFDRVSIRKALEKYSLAPIPNTWLDSARVARRTWPECAQRGYGLASVCKIINYEFNHHDALEDAKACGQIMLAAISITGLTIEDWHKRTNQPLNGSASYNAKVHRDGNPEGDMAGEVLVFTGELLIPRNQAADLAAQIGCNVADNVTKKTTLLVVGDQDLNKLNGKSKSSKHLKAEQLITQGQKIRILKESDFIALTQNL